jgi:hypothetical protein
VVVVVVDVEGVASGHPPRTIIPRMEDISSKSGDVKKEMPSDCGWEDNVLNPSTTMELEMPTDNT